MRYGDVCGMEVWCHDYIRSNLVIGNHIHLSTYELLSLLVIIIIDILIIIHYYYYYYHYYYH